MPSSTAGAIAERATLEGLRVVAEHDSEPAIRDAARAELSRIASAAESRRIGGNDETQG
jgi:hypothetical protein